MPGSFTFTDPASSPAPDSVSVGRGRDFQAFFEDLKDGSPSPSRLAVVESIHRTVGPTPGEARIVISNVSALVEFAPMVAACASATFLGFIAGRKVAIRSVDGDGLVFTGYISAVREDIEHDELIVIAKDARWLMEGVPIFGRISYDDDADAVKFDESGPAVFNASGYRNCTDKGDLGPVFSPVPEWNVSHAGSPDDVTPTSPIQPDPSASVSRHWRCEDALQYLRLYAMYATSPGVTGFHVRSKRATMSTQDLLWSANAIGALPSSDSAGLTKKMTQLSLDGQNLAEAIEMVLRSAGPYTYTVEPVEEDDMTKAVLKIVPLSYDANQAVELWRPVSLPLQGGLHAGDGGWDASNSYNSVLVIGGPLIGECRLQSPNSPAQAGDPPAPPAGYVLDYDWSDAEEATFRTYAVTHGMEDAFEHWPRVFACYAIKRDNDLTLNGTWPAATHPRIARKREPFPFLASGHTEGAQTKRIDHYPLSLEIWSVATTTWVAVPRDLDGLTIREDGTIDLTPLRSPTIAGYKTWQGALSDPLNVTRSRYRLTVAWEHDARLVRHGVLETLKVRGAADMLTADVQDDDDPAKASRLFGPDLVRQKVVDARDLYSEARRYNSYAFRWEDTTPGQVQLPDGLIYSDADIRDAANNSYDLVAEHCLRRLRELVPASGGQRYALEGVQECWSPGMMISTIRTLMVSGDKLQAVYGVVKSVTLRCHERQHTEIELA